MTVSAYAAQEGLEFVIFLPLPPEGWDCRYTIPYLANVSSANLVVINLSLLAMPPSSYMSPTIIFFFFFLLRQGLM